MMKLSGRVETQFLLLKNEKKATLNLNDVVLLFRQELSPAPLFGAVRW